MEVHKLFSNIASNAATAGSSIIYPRSPQGAKTLFFVLAADDPTATNRETEVAVQGRMDSSGEWVTVATIDENTANWFATGASTLETKSAVVTTYPEMRLRHVQDAGSANIFSAWLAEG